MTTLNELIWRKNYNPNQPRDANGKWVGAGIGATPEYFGSGHGKKMLEGLSATERKAVIQALSGVPLKDELLEKVESISTSPPKLFMGGNWDTLIEGHQVAGFLSPEKVLHISPDCIKKSLLVHEFGHAIWGTKKLQRNRSQMVDAGYKILEKAPRDEASLAHFGLRTYSMSGFQELLADSFVVSVLGTSAQRSALGKLWGKKDVADIF